MNLVGENLNIISKVTGAAMKARDPKPIQEMAIRETEAGVDYIDVNMGPMRKDGHECMPWLVKTVQEVTDLPLYLDTSNVEAIREGLKVYEQKKGKAVINSVMARPERMEALIPIAAEYDAAIVALMWGPEGMPRDADERAMLAMELFMAATAAGIAPEDIWFDPIITPVNVQQDQLMHCNAFFQTQQDMFPGTINTCGLSNVSNGPPEHLRAILNQTYLMILMKYGLQGAIVDAFDEDLKAIARGERSEAVSLVHKMIDGEAVDPSTLDKEMLDYYKTVNVLVGKSLFSDSWLEL